MVQTVHGGLTSLQYLMIDTESYPQSWQWPYLYTMPQSNLQSPFLPQLPFIPSLTDDKWSLLHFHCTLPHPAVLSHICSFFIAYMVQASQLYWHTDNITVSNVSHPKSSVVHVQRKQKLLLTLLCINNAQWRKALGYIRCVCGWWCAAELLPTDHGSDEWVFMVRVTAGGLLAHLIVKLLNGASSLGDVLDIAEQWTTNVWSGGLPCGIASCNVAQVASQQPASSVCVLSGPPC